MMITDFSCTRETTNPSISLPGNFPINTNNLRAYAIPFSCVMNPCRGPQNCHAICYIICDTGNNTASEGA